MLYEGSSGETAKEIEKLLHLPDEKNYARMKTSAILRSLQVKFNNQFIPLIQMNLFFLTSFFSIPGNESKLRHGNRYKNICRSIYDAEKLVPENSLSLLQCLHRKIKYDGLQNVY